MERRSYYFAYGSNMDDRQMRRRCPGAECLGRAVLPGYRLAERLYADIDPCPGRSVEGVLWTMGDGDIHALDGHEGVGHGIYARRIRCVLFGGRRLYAYCYEMTSETRRLREGLPFSARYDTVCRSGAALHGIEWPFPRKQSESPKHGAW